MKFIKWAILSATALLTLQQPVWAVTPSVYGSIKDKHLTNTSGTIERGGSITAVDLQNKTITVDGVTYPLLAASLTVHSADPLIAGNPLNLQKNMRIRFNTIIDTRRNERVSEIWITNPGSDPTQKK